MFTGIIEEVGVVLEITSSLGNSKIKIKSCKVLEGTRIGDSIAVNGVCLTVVEIGKDYFISDIMKETFRKTNLNNLKIGDKMNLERALSLSSRLGGHIVSGHIDGTGVIANKYSEGIATWVTINAKEEILKYIVFKGSITIDGISLTVAYVDDEKFKVSIIPHTALETTLLEKSSGELLNLECDIVGKYIEKFVTNNSKEKTDINMSFLRENGFL